MRDIGLHRRSWTIDDDPAGTDDKLKQPFKLKTNL